MSYIIKEENVNQNLNYYKVFYTVANTKNISKAADELFISQPGISKSISKLEANMGCTLFIRNSKGVQLTEEGELLYSHIKEAFDFINSGEESLKRMSNLGIGQIRIGVSTSLCKYILMPYLQEFVKLNPHIKINIECNSTIETLALLDEGKIDIGLICHSEKTNNMEYYSIGEIEDIFVANQTYLDNLEFRLSEKDTSKSKNTNKLSSKEILENSNLMLLDKENITRIHVDKYFAEKDIHPNQLLEINNMDLLIDFANIGLGVACVVKQFVKKDLASGNIVQIPLKSSIRKRTIGFVYPAGKYTPTATKKFIEFCKGRNEINQ